MTKASYPSWIRAPWLLVATVLLCAIPVTPAQPGIVVFDDQDWRGSDLVANADGIERQLISSLLLYTEMAEPVFLFDPTEDETITTVTDFQGKLYLGSCTRPADTDTGSVFTYDPETHAWEKVFQVNEQGLVRFEVYGDRLYIPGYDANDGGWDLGNIYVYDGESWVEHRTVPRAVHIYGLAVYRDRIYVSADVFDEPPPGKTVDQAGDEGLISIYGQVLSSGDGGLTWREEYRGPQDRQDIGFMAVFEDKLIVNASGDLLVFDGESWGRLGLNPNALIVLDYAVAGDTLAMATSLGICFLNSEGFRFFDSAGAFQVRGFVRFGDWWAMPYLHVPAAHLEHGPGGTRYAEVTDEGGWYPFHSGVWVLHRDVMDRAARRPLAPMEHEPSHHVPSQEMLVSAHAFKGRLFLGTHPEGRVLVLPVVTEGTLEAAPRAVTEPGEYVLSWEGAAPEGTSCGLQVRSAPDIASLNEVPFTGPDGKADSIHETSGVPIDIPTAGFVQYRVVMKTENPALSPYLKRVTLRAAD